MLTPTLTRTLARARLSYRRAAELFQSATAPLDPAGRGWSLRQLRLAGKLENERRLTESRHPTDAGSDLKPNSGS